MIWDKLAPFYDLFESVYNGKVFRGIAEEIKGIYTSLRKKVYFSRGLVYND